MYWFLCESEVLCDVAQSPTYRYNNEMKTKHSLSLLLIVLITACTPGGNSQSPQTADMDAVMTPTVLASETLVPTLSATFTPAPTATATLIPLTGEELDRLNRMYRILVFIQVDMSMLEEIAEKVQAGELVGIESLGALMVLATVVNEVDTALQEVTPPELLREPWQTALQIHEETKQMITDWVNQHEDSAGILAATPEKMAAMEDLMNEVESVLSEYYGFDQEEMRRSREAVVESVNEIFATEP